MAPRQTRHGETGPDVVAWQAYLVRRGYDPGPIDGLHGPKTDMATAAWLADTSSARAAQDATDAACAAERVATLAESYVGCGVVAQRERYLDLVMSPADRGPDATHREEDFARMSGCALVCRGLLRLAGLGAHPILRSPYRAQSAMQDLIDIGRDAGAWRVPLHGARPARGDVVLVTSGDGGHAYCVTACDEDELASVDGGQKCPRSGQLIAPFERTWHEAKGRVTDRTKWKARPVLGWIDVGALGW